MMSSWKTLGSLVVLLLVAAFLEVGGDAGIPATVAPRQPATIRTLAAIISSPASTNQPMWQRYQTLFALLLCTTAQMVAQSVNATFDARGITSLSYGGTSLIDLAAGRGDGFLVGTYQLGSKSAWGGVGNQATWDAAAQRVTWSWPWGKVETSYRLDNAHSVLSIAITITNNSRETLEAINVYPLGLQFPALPANFGAPNIPQFRNALDGPPVILADYGASSITFVHREPTPLYLGLTPSGAPNHYQLQVGTVNDPSSGFLGKALPVHRTIPPGKTDAYNIELRFGPSKCTIISSASDILRAYGKAWPQTLKWVDRRPIGELFLTDPVSKPRPESHPNPRSYNFSGNANVHTPEGKAQYRKELLAYADRSIAILKKGGAQGAIIWDLEGQQFPQPNTSYIGDPALLPKLAPEMDAVADEFFAKFKAAGLRSGLTIRPQHLDTSANPPQQRNLSRDAEAANLIAKVEYAHKRWGCTLFYVDSDGGPNDATSPDTFAAVARRFPDVLLIPENIWPRDYAYAAPLASFTAPYKPLHTPDWIQTIWPQAFTVTYIGDAPAHNLHSNPSLWSGFQTAKSKGDVMAFRAWFDDQPLNSQLNR